MHPKLEVCNTEKYGKGVFATAKIKKDELICVFGGYIKALTEEEKLPKAIQDEGLQISATFALGIIKISQLENAAFFNHSCDPNSGFKGQIFLVAMRNIKKGEQVTFDYAMVLSKAKNVSFYKIKCFCGANNCRGYVTENDWKKPELQKKYDGYFQWYLQDKIKRYGKNKKI